MNKRFSDAEIELIKKSFKNDEKLLIAIRNIFYQIPYNGMLITKETLLTKIKPLLGVLKKTFVPDFDPTTSLFQQGDLYFLLKDDLRTLNPGVVTLRIKALDLAKEYLEQQFGVLTGEVSEPRIKLLSLRDPQGGSDEDRLVNLSAYLLLTNSFIESSLEMLNQLANKKDESEEEKAKRLKANSSK